MRVFFIFLTILLFSCTNRVTYYTYNGTTVTRVDKDGEVRFYYGYLKDNQSEHPYIKVEYSGLNSGVDGFLRFNPNKTVEVFSYGGGYFTQSKDAGKEIYLKDYDNPELDSLLKSYGQNYANLIRVADVVELERKRSFAYNSKVVVKDQ